MAYRLKYKGFEIECETVASLDELIAHFGEGGAAPAADGAAEAPSPKHGRTGGNVPAGRRPASGAHASDEALLHEFLKAAERGVKGKMIEGMLPNAHGKGLRGALQRWAVRIGVSQNAESFPFEACRTDGARAWRMTESGLSVARRVGGV